MWSCFTVLYQMWHRSKSGGSNLSTATLCIIPHSSHSHPHPSLTASSSDLSCRSLAARVKSNLSFATCRPSYAVCVLSLFLLSAPLCSLAAMVASLWGPAYKGLGGYFRKMGELIISPANYPFMIGAVSSFALIASIPVTDKDIRESSQPSTTISLTHSLTHSLSTVLRPTAMYGSPPALSLDCWRCALTWMCALLCCLCAEFSNRVRDHGGEEAKDRILPLTRPYTHRAREERRGQEVKEAERRRAQEQEQDSFHCPTSGVHCSHWLCHTQYTNLLNDEVQ